MVYYVRHSLSTGLRFTRYFDIICLETTSYFTVCSFDLVTVRMTYGRKYRCDVIFLQGVDPSFVDKLYAVVVLDPQGFSIFWVIVAEASAWYGLHCHI